MKKKILVLATMTLLLCSCGKIPTVENGKEAVVTFKDGSAITADELYQELKTSYGFTLLLTKIDDKILNDKYKDEEEGKTKYAENYIEYIKSYYKEEAEYTNYINSIGFSNEDELKDYLKLTYLRNLAITEYGKSLVTDEDINDYYEKEIVGDIKVSHILIEPQVKDDMTDEEKKAAEVEAENKAKELIKELKKAEDAESAFAELAKKNSADEGSAENGGSLGFINKGSVNDEFDKAAYELKDKSYTTTPVKSSQGYHIIYRFETKEKAKLDEVKTTIIETLGNKKLTDNKENEINALTELRKKYGVDIVDTELSTNYANYVQNQISSLSK